jgi:hypothetical protein
MNKRFFYSIILSVFIFTNCRKELHTDSFCKKVNLYVKDYGAIYTFAAADWLQIKHL